MSYCAVSTSAPSVATNPPLPNRYVAPVVLSGAPGNLVERVDDNCGVIPAVVTPPDETIVSLTFVASNNEVIVEKNSVITFNVNTGVGTLNGAHDYVLSVGSEGSVQKGVVQFQLIIDTSSTVPAAQGTITEGSTPGEFTFTPTSGYTGTVNPWTYTATDAGVEGVVEATGTVNIRVVEIGALPVCRGLQWKGHWEDGKTYQDGIAETCKNQDVVKLVDNQALFVCIKSHTAAPENAPMHSNTNGPVLWPEFWEMMNEDVGTLAIGPELTLLEQLTNGLFDWMKNATIGDWAKAILTGIGITLAGQLILDMFTDDGGDGEADSRYNGSPSYTGVYEPPSLQSVCRSLCEEAGIPNFDVSALPTTIACHFSLSQQTSVRTILDNLSRAFQFDMVDSAGVLKFMPRNTNPVRTLTYEDMGFNSSNSSVAPITMKRLQSVDLPRSVSLTYMAEDLDYNNFTQRSEIATFSAGNDINLSVPFMLTHADAKEATDKLLIGAHLERMQYTFKTSYINTIDLEPSDVIMIPTGAVRIVQIEEVDEGVLEIHCVDAGSSGTPTEIIEGGVVIGTTASTYIGSTGLPQLPAPVVNVPSVVTRAAAIWFDPPVQGSEDVYPRVYAAVHAFGVPGWRGAEIYISRDGGGSYNAIATTVTESTWGVVNAITPTKIAQVWDDTTVIRVKLKTGTLLSASDTAVLSGENLCMIGQECLAFGVATLVGVNTYDISHLLRGRRGTEWATSAHVADELFVRLDNAPVVIDFPESDRGKKYLFKVVSYGSDLTKVEAQEIQIIGENTIPWTVGSLTGAKVGSDFVLNWKERPRYINELREFTDVGHDVDFGGYAVIVYQGTAVVHQEIVYNPTYTYTLARQLSDFGGAQINLKVEVLQVSNKFGGSRPVIVNI